MGSSPSSASVWVCDLGRALHLLTYQVGRQESPPAGSRDCTGLGTVPGSEGCVQRHGHYYCDYFGSHAGPKGLNTAGPSQ